MLPTTDDSLFKIEGGNALLAEQSIKAANATLMIAEVAKVKRQKGLYQLELKVIRP